MKISIIIITYERIIELKETLINILECCPEVDEVIIVDNNSKDGTKEYLKEISSQNNKILTYSLDENKGVAGGRNFAIEKSRGDILIFIDDDAIFNSIDNIQYIRKTFIEYDKVGILAFKIVNYYSNKVKREEFPFTNKKINQQESKLTSTFIGAGHAIKREVFNKCGLYPEDYFYGKEELDLSFRAINEGYEILYYPKVEVLHKQSTSGRLPNYKKWEMVYRNRLVIGKKYLGLKYRIISAIIWFIKIVVITKSAMIPIKSINNFLEEKDKIKEIKINKTAVNYLKKNYGRLWY